MPFIQIIEITTTRPDAIEALTIRWVTDTEGRRKTRRATSSADRDRPNTYLQIVDFATREEALENSNLPETSRFAQELADLCEVPPVFRNLDLRCDNDLG